MKPAAASSIIPAMPKKPSRGAVTPAEFQVMCVLWELGAGTVAAVHAAAVRSNWSDGLEAVLDRLRDLAS